MGTEQVATFSRRTGQYVTFSFLFTIALFSWILWKWMAGAAPLAPPASLASPREAFLLFSLGVLISEWKAIEMPFHGHISIAFAFYFSTLLLFGILPATVLATGGSLFRVLVVSRQKFANRVLEVSGTLSSVMISGAVYQFLQRLEPRPWSLLHFLILLFSFTAYYGCESLISSTALGYSGYSSQKGWFQRWSRVKLFYVSIFPISCLLAYLSATSLWLSLLLVLPLLSLHYGLEFLVVQEYGKTPSAMERIMLQAVNEKERVEQRAAVLEADLGRKIDEAVLLRELAEALAGNLDLSHALAAIVQMAYPLFKADTCMVYFIKEGNFLLQKGFVPPLLEEAGMRENLPQTLLGKCAQEKEPLLLNGHQEIERLGLSVLHRSEMVCPIVISQDVIGVIVVGTTRTVHYQQGDLYTLSLLASFCAVAFQNAYLYESQRDAAAVMKKMNLELERKIEELSILHALMQDLESSHDLESKLKVIIRAIGKFLSYQSCVIFLSEEVGGEMVLKADSFETPYAGLFQGFALKLNEGVVGKAAAKKQAVLCRGAGSKEEERLIEYEDSSVVAPMIVKGEMVGVIYIGAKEENAYTPEHLSLITTVAYQSALAVKNAQLLNQATSLAITDGLTGLNNHRFFQECLLSELKRAERFKKQFSVLMMDVDGFKPFNDTYGHPRGDQLLKDIGKLLKGYVRENDVVSRYGGDEFSLILIETGLQDARQIAERIREAFHLRFGSMGISVSVGLASYPLHGQDKAGILSMADQALYRAKQEKNRVAVL